MTTTIITARRHGPTTTRHYQRKRRAPIRHRPTNVTPPPSTADWRLTTGTPHVNTHVNAHQMEGDTGHWGPHRIDDDGG
ncbi:hypothetical protein K443DRAFT_12603 [Laccaria amethystina LaAM-08-1]|uniref:Uncharacterized protein n=1 Tax=Laccaria amethystina LaAM-08-1 TaxID=1095629 RepID=A0A0C9WXY5_9AGAR|nr:hypothetical protein K443DRAFT_12603 [Laccaria amethystina LaAM-08-1]